MSMCNKLYENQSCTFGDFSVWAELVLRGTARATSVQTQRNLQKQSAQEPGVTVTYSVLRHQLHGTLASSV